MYKYIHIYISAYRVNPRRNKATPYLFYIGDFKIISKDSQIVDAAWKHFAG